MNYLDQIIAAASLNSVHTIAAVERIDLVETTDYREPVITSPTLQDICAPATDDHVRPVAAAQSVIRCIPCH